MSFHLTDLDGQLGRHSMLDPSLSYSTTQASNLAAKRCELNRALAARRRQRRAAKVQAARNRAWSVVAVHGVDDLDAATTRIGELTAKTLSRISLKFDRTRRQAAGGLGSWGIRDISAMRATPVPCKAGQCGPPFDKLRER